MKKLLKENTVSEIIFVDNPCSVSKGILLMIDSEEYIWLGFNV